MRDVAKEGLRREEDAEQVVQAAELGVFSRTSTSNKSRAQMLHQERDEQLRVSTNYFLYILYFYVMVY